MGFPLFFLFEYDEYVDRPFQAFLFPGLFIARSGAEVCS